MLVYKILGEVIPALEEVRIAEQKLATAWANVWVSALLEKGGKENPDILKKEARKLHINFPCTCEFLSFYMMSEVVKLLKEKFDVDEVVAYYPGREDIRVVILTEKNREKACWGGQCESFYTIEGVGPTWVLT